MLTLEDGTGGSIDANFYAGEGVDTTDLAAIRCPRDNLRWTRIRALN